jgi:mannose-6-phosphate isomerase
MPVRKLAAKGVERVWGRKQLPLAFRPFETGQPVGEVWHVTEGEDAPLLVKHLFTSERLSIQVHPNDAAAQAKGFARGKDEAWFVIAAEPEATIGLGLNRRADREQLRAAALDGSIEQLVDWRPVEEGEFFYSPAGTIHAIGGGVALVEIQQNVDLTYRLYDYGRSRELHLDEGLNVADGRPWMSPFEARERGSGRTILAAGGPFVIERWRVEGAAHWLLPANSVLVPLAGEALLDGADLRPARVCQGEGAVDVSAARGLDILVAYPGGSVREDLRR